MKKYMTSSPFGSSSIHHKIRKRQIAGRCIPSLLELFTPNPDRLRDWISTPKANGYESLHTTVMGASRGRWVEVQIRTVRMDEIAEMGFAAHWKYKEGTADKSLDTWLREIRELLRNPDYNALEFLDDFKSNLFSKEIYVVFTIKVTLKILPQDSTALDFAFEIHTDRAIIVLVPRSTTSWPPDPPAFQRRPGGGDHERKQKPNEDWLGFLITSRARSKGQACTERRKAAGGTGGKRHAGKKDESLKLPLDDKNMAELMSYYHQPTSLELFYRIQNKDIDPEGPGRIFRSKEAESSHPSGRIKGRGTINPNLITANADLLILMR